ncbi:MAG: hypothetical protein H6739_32270 [Alphaproteobacteria bacterium]|nr:hypothetical protein [Alphaproteobacteria bacterium]
MPSDLWEVWISASVADPDADLAGFTDEDGRLRGAGPSVGSVDVHVIHIKRHPDEVWQPSSGRDEEYLDEFNIWEGDFTIRRHTSDDVLHGRVSGELYFGTETVVIGDLNESWDAEHCPELDDT